MPDGGEDIELLVRQLVSDHHGVDVVVAICYNDGNQKSYALHHTNDLDACRKLVAMAWQAIKPDPARRQPSDDEETE